MITHTRGDNNYYNILLDSTPIHILIYIYKQDTTRVFILPVLAANTPRSHPFMTTTPPPQLPGRPPRSSFSPPSYTYINRYTPQFFVLFFTIQQYFVSHFSFILLLLATPSSRVVCFFGSFGRRETVSPTR